MRIEIDGKWQFYKTYHGKDYIQSHDTRKHVVLKEKREPSEYRMHNNSEKEIVVYRIDGGLIASNEQQKCDYGIYTERDVLSLIELKGGDFIAALEQILKTIENLLITIRVLNDRDSSVFENAELTQIIDRVNSNDKSS